MGATSRSWLRATSLLLGTLLFDAARASMLTWKDVPAVTKSQTMFRRTRENFNSPRPYIEFKVTCEADTGISWILIAASKDGVGVHNRTVALPNQPCSSDADCTRGRCGEHGVCLLSQLTGACVSTHQNQYNDLANATDGDDGDDGDAFADDEDDDGFACNEVLVTQKQQFDGSEAEEEFKYCCDTPDPRTPKWRGSNLLFSDQYRDRYIAGATFHCKKGVTVDEGGTTIIKNIPFDGHYTLYIQSNIDQENPSTPLVDLSGYVKYVNLSGQLAAGQYPLMVFYGIMGLFYLFLGIGWLVAMALHYQDLLRLQFWLGGVIFLGMIEFSFAYGNLDWINSNGTTSGFLFVLAQLLHAGKSTAARILVLVVSMGYGVVKPRLGAAYKQVVVFGVLYMAMASLYGITHIPPSDGPVESKYAMMAVVPLSVLDAGVLWWIFFALHHTMKILALRQNTVKLQLYQRFRLLLAFFAIAAILFFGWTLYNSWDTATNHAWENAWLLEAFQHILFSIVLIGILVLWRPSMNNSRYAYATLETDLLDDEDYQVVPNFGSETMTSRTKSSRGLPPPQIRESVEDELAWVEENIPASVLSNDNTLASLQMDSDEDIMETRILMNKME